jgi:metacaspase-1
MSNSVELIETQFRQQLSQLDAFYSNNYRKIITSRMAYRIKNFYIAQLQNIYTTNKTNLITNKNNRIKEYLQQQQQQLELNQRESEQKILNNIELKALIIGINYLNTISELYGCINDANHLQTYFTNKYNFNTNNLCLLTDNTIVKPTKQNILKKYKDLLINAKSGEKLFFTYSGHGSFRPDLNNDENDGKDELLITIDKQSISDDELKTIIDENLPEDVTLFVIFDCCHSGTLMDLKYNYLSGNEDLVINEKISETKSNVFLISGCFDAQTSADAYIDNKFQGALTWSLLKTINENTNLTWKDLLINMRTLLNPRYSQIPQLSSGKLIDINSPLLL